MPEISSNKRIAKNTLFLYFRMMVTMIVSLITTRVVLNALGESNFGIYNIVGGVVVLFVFIQNSLATAVQRFLSISLGECDTFKYNEIYSASIYCNIVISLIIVLLGETVGLWFLNCKLNLPDNSMNSANIVYQLCLLNAITNLFRVPFEAVIISHERMSFYAYLSILETILKLAVAYSLYIYSGNKLVFYAILMTFVPFGSLLAFYCYSHYKLKSHFIIRPNIITIRSILGFSGWSLMGATANVAARQGGNILINIFYGVLANAAYGIANQVNSALVSLINSFQIAFRPQVIKLYAQENFEKLFRLSILTSFCSFYILLVFLVPFSINSKEWLSIWLKQVPPYAASFSILILVYSLIDASQGAFMFMIYARNSIRNYQLWLSVLLFLNIPISYLFLSLGFSPNIILIVYASINLISAIIRLSDVARTEKFPVGFYVRYVLSRMLLVLALSVGAGLFIKHLLSSIYNNFMYSSIISAVVVIVLSYSIGIPTQYKASINRFVKQGVVRLIYNRKHAL